MLDIRHTNDPQVVRTLLADGFEPIECSLAGISIVGPLVMDHHGERSHLEGVAVRAYRDHAGARAKDPRFVVTGRGDADATFAIAAIAGRLPTRTQVDLTGLANLVNRLDTVPIGIDPMSDPWGAHVLLWNELARPFPEEAESFVAGVALWRRLITDPPRRLLEASLAGERDRRDAARAAPVIFERGRVRVVRSALWGYDVWYELRGDPATASGWRWPVVLVFDPGRHAIDVGCPSASVAEELFGPGGLKNVFASLEPRGWGGRESIGGSPRGVQLDESAAICAGEALAARL